jgi:hypothetical protein
MEISWYRSGYIISELVAECLEHCGNSLPRPTIRGYMGARDPNCGLGKSQDDAVSRELLSISLHSCHEFELVGAYSTGEQALKELPKKAPNVVLMDIKLPGMSGIECLAALRRHVCRHNPSSVEMKAGDHTQSL